MNLQQLHCPTCAAPVQIPADATTTQCPFCRSQITVERSLSDATASLATQVSGAIAGSNVQMQSALAQANVATRDELRRSQLVQELNSVEMQLTTIQSEIRSVQRLPASAVTRKQLKELRHTEATLLYRHAALQAALNPTPEGAAEPLAKVRPQTTWQRQLFGFGGRASRKLYWVALVAGTLLLVIGSVFVPSAPASETEVTVTCLALPGLIFIAASLWMWAAVSAKRYHDRNKSAWWVLVALIPYIGWLWQVVELGFFPGTTGRNRFGAPT